MARPLAQVLSYQKDLVDAVTCGPVTDSTTLVNLHKPDEDTGNGKLLACLTGIARPAKSCFLVLEDGETLGLSFARGEAPYYLHFTFNRLLTAPAARVECLIPTGTPGESPLKVSLEFAFTNEARQSEHIALEKFEVQPRVERFGRRKDEIVFDSYGASCEGLVNAEKRALALGEPVARILAVLRGLITNRSGTTLRFRFFNPIESWDSALPVVLPYIDGRTKLPSLLLPAWSTLWPPKPERSIAELLTAPAPHPMVQFECGGFTTPTQACVEYYESARIQHLEEDTALGQWKAVDHFGTLYQVGGAVVMALRFGDFKQLGGPGVGHFTLPDKLTVKMRWENRAGDQFHCDAARSTLPIQLPSVHDALFIITKANDKMLEACVKPSDDVQGEIFNVHVTSSENKFTLTSKLSAAVNLVHPDSSRWHDLLMNHDNSALETVDLAMKRVDDVEITPEIEKAVESAMRWLLTFQNWNEEQLIALRSLRSAVGSMVLISGPAGTGKTLVLQALCAFFYKLGLHVLVLAPANSNVKDFMAKLNKLFPEIDATRVFPSSKDFSPDKIAKKAHRGEDPKNSTQGPLQEAETDILEFDMVRAEVDSRDKQREKFDDCGLAAQVLKLAREGKISNVEVVAGVSEDSWGILRACIEQATEGTFDWRNVKDVQKYQKAYDACKAHHMALCRLVATTTGNFRCDDIVNNWAMEKHGVECRGIIYVLEEGCKDTEIDSISPMVFPEYRHKITGVVMLGDERQLEPCNTSAKGQLCFNNFTDRLSIPLLSRLKAEGFPCTELVVQHRMSKHIAHWPSQNFYAGGMLNGPGTEHTLAHKKPGLYYCAMNIISRLDASFNTTTDPVNQDKALRTHYFSIAGTRDSSKRSPFVNEHVRFFFNEIFWDLHAYYGESMNENVMIIVAYKGTKQIYQEAMSYLQKKHQIPACQLPQLLTIDSSQGCEAPVTIIDCAVQQYDPRLKNKHIGFVDDDKRMNVAFTRAKDVRWVMGGACSVALRSSQGRQETTPAYVRYRDEVEGTGELTKLPMQKLRQGEDWIKKLEKRTVCCGLKFRDEVTETEE
ncbi:hypothetical protein TI39_contig5851g00006 [Zymoseptoria brevis]|uniref:DNA2/NAM7 helicase-like C-terminal domain-containing protein n=1 Tax=Zymoseptoria brevis TaxID=1047168 RepID=A0A0F4G583_9PEZI|nr:hypothetical protein TI39_contig5851g00006 [Zymoseptoria brevis]